MKFTTAAIAIALAYLGSEVTAKGDRREDREGKGLGDRRGDKVLEVLGDRQGDKVREGRGDH